MHLTINHAIAALGVAAIVQLSASFWAGDDQVPEPPMGDYITSQVVPTGGGTAVPLYSLALGRCVYLIFADPGCPYSRAQAAHWEVTMNHDSAAIAPGSWRIVWVATAGSGSTNQLWGPRFPAAQYTAHPSVLRSAGLKGVPSHVVLDRSGRLTAASNSAALPPYRNFKDDCTIIW